MIAPSGHSSDDLVQTVLTMCFSRRSGMVGSFSKVLWRAGLLKLNFGIMCLHILLMSRLVALPSQLADKFPCARQLEGVSGSHEVRSLLAPSCLYYLCAGQNGGWRQVFLLLR